MNSLKGTIKEIGDIIVSVPKGVEEILSPDAILLPRFARSIQVDGWSCGAQSAYMILKYHRKARSIKNVHKELGTNEDGTSEDALKRLFRKRGLSVYEFKNPTLAKLENAIDRRSPILIHVSTRKIDHWAVVYGYDKGHIWVADPSLKRPLCRQTRASFRSRWKGYGIVVGIRK
jgi:ABC-type bacteriocin/lantibiotic exporter with double-glycine peptidase domain